MDRIFGAFYLSFLFAVLVNGFVVLQSNGIAHRPMQQQQQRLHTIYDKNLLRELEDPRPEANAQSSRRRLLHNWLAIGIGGVAATSPLNEQTRAMEQPRPDDTIWMTGKMPMIPGQKPKDKSDVAGTRKDPNFLRSLSDCKNQCENMTGASNNAGYAKGKEECLSECQDICCTTYQQCTFPIVQRI